MTNGDRQSTCSRAIAIVAGQVQLTQMLKEALADEHAALQKQDTDAVEATALTKSALVKRLQQQEDLRVQLCAGNGIAAGDEQMQQFIAHYDDDDRLSDVWANLLQLAGECRDMNMTNGAAIRLRQQHFTASLSILSGMPLGQDTYTSHGATATAGESRAIATA